MSIQKIKLKEKALKVFHFAVIILKGTLIQIVSSTTSD